MEKRAYSLVHLTQASCTPPDLIYAAAAAGYDYVSLRSIPTRMSHETSAVSEKITGQMPFALSDRPELLRATKEAVRATGVEIHDTENARIFNGVSVKNYEKDLETAAELGIKDILTNIWTDDRALYTEAFGSLCDLAKPYGIFVNLEFVTWAEVKNLRDAANLLHCVKRENAGIVLDTLHFYRSKDTIEELQNLPKNWFRYVHLCSCPEEIPKKREELIQTGLSQRLFPGEGAVDIRSILENLNPDIICGLEVPNPQRMDTAGGLVPYIKEALKTAKKYLGENSE